MASAKLPFNFGNYRKGRSKMKTKSINIKENETQSELSERAEKVANQLTKQGKVVICIQTLPDYAEINYFD